ncbi:hypothetical protein D3C81_479270 [compost metagenome]
MEQLPPGFLPAHCAKARTKLGWSVEALAFRSGVSSRAIRGTDNRAELRRVTMQALAFAKESGGLVFFPDHPPLTSQQLSWGHTSLQDAG